MGVLASVRTTRVSGFDLRAFNAFRVSEGARCAYDLEHLEISEPGVTAAALESRSDSNPAVATDLQPTQWRLVSAADAADRW